MMTLMLRPPGCAPLGSHFVRSVSASPEASAHGCMWQDQLAQIAQVRGAPAGMAGVAIAVTEQKGLQPATRPVAIIDRVGARTAEITDGLVGRVGHVDRLQIASAQQARELLIRSLPLVSPLRGLPAAVYPGRS